MSTEKLAEVIDLEQARRNRWADYLADVRSWKRARPEDVQHAEMIGNALDGGQTLFQATVGYALTQHNSRVVRLPRKLRRPAGRHQHQGRVTLAARPAVGSGVREVSRRYAAHRDQLEPARLARRLARLSPEEQLEVARRVRRATNRRAA